MCKNNRQTTKLLQVITIHFNWLGEGIVGWLGGEGEIFILIVGSVRLDGKGLQLDLPKIASMFLKNLVCVTHVCMANRSCRLRPIGLIKALQGYIRRRSQMNDTFTMG